MGDFKRLAAWHTVGDRVQLDSELFSCRRLFLLDGPIINEGMVRVKGGESGRIRIQFPGISLPAEPALALGRNATNFSQFPLKPDNGFLAGVQPSTLERSSGWNGALCSAATLQGSQYLCLTWRQVLEDKGGEVLGDDHHLTPGRTQVAILVLVLHE